jgi:8-oxo-dGTP pyrophosphatase MutT (NUDIX family)
MAEERSAGFVVFRNEGGKRLYLLLQHAGGRWDFPKGNIERGETPNAAALRELKEETGIAKVRQEVGWEKRIGYFYRKGSKTVHKGVVFYLGEAGGGSVVVSAEHKSAAWLPFGGAVAALKHENAKRTIASAEKFLASRS